MFQRRARLAWQFDREVPVPSMSTPLQNGAQERQIGCDSDPAGTVAYAFINKVAQHHCRQRLKLHLSESGLEHRQGRGLRLTARTCAGCDVRVYQVPEGRSFRRLRMAARGDLEYGRAWGGDGMGP